VGFKPLGQEIVGTGEQQIYAPASGKTAITSQIVISNNTTAQVKVTVNFRVGGATLAAKHKTFKDLPVDVGDPVVLPGGQGVTNPDIISATCDTASGAVVTVFGQEMPA
jgi:hypothetical protein